MLQFDKHVISNIHGGLGNQMFMYAIARALALRNNAKLILEYDDSGNNDGFGRHYELQAFNVAGTKSLCLSYVNILGRLLRKLYNISGVKLPYIPSKTVIELENFAYNPAVLVERGLNIYLIGYWQSEKYFKDFELQIRKDFEYKIQFSKEIKIEYDLIQSYGNRAVAFCVRRYQEVQQFIHLRRAEKDYYNKALQELKKHIANPVLFCFSQDPDWVQREFADCGIEILFITPKSGKNASHEDMYLLRSFRNFIISNSTYYWWGAWLSPAKDKIVISPDNWCCNESNCHDWIVIR